jgi:hypothetical protein
MKDFKEKLNKLSVSDILFSILFILMMAYTIHMLVYEIPKISDSKNHDYITQSKKTSEENIKK